MNAYAITPLIATIAYIPLLVFTAGSRPWHRRNLLFLLFLISAVAWGLIVYLFRVNIAPSLDSTLFKLSVIFFAVSAVQFHVFLSSYYPSGQRRWLTFSYVALAATTALVMVGSVTSNAIMNGVYVHGSYRIGIVFVAGLLLTIAARNIYVFGRIYRQAADPVVRNRAFTLLLSVFILVIFSVVSLPAWFNAFPFAHYGNLLNAFILSYAVLRHNLIDIRLFLRKSAAWITFAVVGILAYWLVIVLLHTLMQLPLDYSTLYVSTGVAVVTVAFLFKMRSYFFEMMTRAFQGSRYDIRRRLDEFTDRIHSVFSLKDQGSELLVLLLRAINVNQACLMFPEAGSDEYIAQFIEPRRETAEFASFRLRSDDLIINHLKREHTILVRDEIETNPAFLGMWAKEREEVFAHHISMFVPLISRDQLIAVLVLGSKVSGRFTLEDFNIISDVTNRVAVSMEKEYLSQQLREREEELSVINNSSAIFASSLDIQEIFGSFIEELKKVVEVTWASIVLEETGELRCVALSSPENSEYLIGDRIPAEGSGVGWVIANHKVFIEPDLQEDSYFPTDESQREHGLRTVAYLPLIAKGRIIGSFIVASSMPNAYTHRHVKLLEQLAAQIAMPLENSQLYVQAEKRARVDELTGLLNRRSLDEMLDNEISRHSRYGGEFALAILDLDNFKVYNDTFGHLSGDVLLREIGASIKASIRTSDNAFRYGGDEFAIVLPQTDIEAARQVAERVGHRIAANNATEKVVITASIGIAIWPKDGITHTDIINAADSTLYFAKRSGGNQVVCASSVSGADILAGALGSQVRSGDDRFIEVANMLARTVDDASRAVGNHSLSVAEYAGMIGRELEITPSELQCLQTGALLHDVGKLAIDEALLQKTGGLTPQEMETVKGHCRSGASIVGNIPEIAHCREAVLHHHEWFDGTGYPDGLRGTDIPLASRVLRLADAFTNMTSPNVGGTSLSPSQALEEIKKNAGKQFDPQLVAVFVSAYEKQHAGAKHKVRR